MIEFLQWLSAAGFVIAVAAIYIGAWRRRDEDRLGIADMFVNPFWNGKRCPRWCAEQIKLSKRIRE